MIPDACIRSLLEQCHRIFIERLRNCLNLGSRFSQVHNSYLSPEESRHLAEFTFMDKIHGCHTQTSGVVSVSYSRRTSTLDVANHCYQMCIRDRLLHVASSKASFAASSRDTSVRTDVHALQRVKISNPLSSASARFLAARR